MKKRIIILATLVCLTFTGCGANAFNSFDSSSKSEVSMSSPGLNSTSYDYSDNSYEESAAESCDVAEVSDDMASPDAEATSADSEGATSSKAIKLSEDKIVYHGNLDISTSNFDESKKALNDLMDKYGAVLESEDFSIYNNVKHESISIRIPAGNFYDFINSTGEIGKVTSNNTYSENITKSYIDVQSRISAYEKKVERINSLLDSATKLEDITDLYNQLSEAEYELENAKSQLMNMDTDVAYSYLSIDLKDTHRYTEDGDLQGDGSYWSDLAYSVWDSISSFADILGGLLIGLVYLFPYIILGIIIFAIVMLVKRIRTKKSMKQRRAEKKAQKDMQANQMRTNLQNTNGQMVNQSYNPNQSANVNNRTEG